MAGKGEPQQASTTKVAAVVLFYFVISISLVFLNKVLLSSPGTSIDAPLFVTWFQCVVTAAICWGLGVAGRNAEPGTFLYQFPEMRLNKAVVMSVLKLSFIFVGMITFNNLCLKYVEVSYYNVARSLTIVFNVALSFVILGQSTSIKVLGCLAVVVGGFFLGAGGEVRFSLIGTIFGVTSSLFVSLNSIYTKETLGLVKPFVDANRDKMWLLTGVNNVIASVLFLPIILVTEADVLYNSAETMASASFWMAMMGSGILGFLIGIAVVLQISVTSPLTHNISGTAKAAVQTVGALMIWQNPTNVQNMAGVATVLLGSMAYAYVRYMETLESKAAAKRAATGAADGAAVQPAGHPLSLPRNKDSDA
ncbi:hypothetical protein FNF29_01495 [Cafeteria roenbergensis]|uniref:Sugar phosphate transporter domain-containing protein n=1 Tax=Cafeteria roenbergensis TaxID=33653 RepID=A0A5A8D957_CAFRO|nr:hypothetical protein FNF29_01495 [Cafeteria roenbergensis]KAA0161084.1 hypothetical protein FNF28_05186 [Cafeteria roenbergensis]CAE7539969.1 Slc35c1 [Symbiodinium sp. KB8]|eukprot:KAA0155578.1 hypothetical protein FNF29_01495 [Cafeteria roenbergensis]